LAQALTKLGLGFGKLPIARRGVSATPSRHAPCQTTGTCKYCPFGARYVASNYLDDIREWNDYPNFDIRLGYAVERINTASPTKAASVDFTDTMTGQHDTVEAERIIVAAGTIESAKLLLRSTSVDWPTGLGNGGDMVGRNLVTHPYLIFTGSLPANPLKLQPEMTSRPSSPGTSTARPNRPTGNSCWSTRPTPCPSTWRGSCRRASRAPRSTPMSPGQPSSRSTR
jgi:hypothetical protein